VVIILATLLEVGLNLKSTVKFAIGIPWLAVHSFARCPICSGLARTERAYGRLFRVCLDEEACGFGWAGDFPNWIARMGMGLTGSWGGLEQGGQREDYLVRSLSGLGQKSFLLLGVGATRVFRVLKRDGFNVEGADVSVEVVNHWRQSFGDSFFHADNLRSRGKKYDAIICCEVVEHWLKPNEEMQTIRAALSLNGIFAGCTNMRTPHEAVEDGTSPGYMAALGHQAYWTERSFAALAGRYSLGQSAFAKMLKPGVLDGVPNKRLFFVSDDSGLIDQIRKIIPEDGVIPLDAKSYRPNDYT